MDNDEMTRALEHFAKQGITFEVDDAGPTGANANTGDPASSIELGMRFLRISSGLFVPEDAAQPVAPIDRIHTFIDLQEAVGADVPPGYLSYEIRRLPIISILVFVASLLGDLRAPGADREALDRHYARTWFREPTRTRVLNLLKSPRRVLAAPQAALVLLKLGLLHSPRVTPTGQEASLPGALLATAGGLGSEGDFDSDDDLVIAERPGPLGRELIANHHFHAEVEPTHLMARFYERWFGPSGDWLRNEYLEATGVPLEDVLMLALGFWSRAVQQEYVTHLSYFAGLPGWDRPRVLKAVSLFARSLEEVAAGVRSESETFGIEWAISTLEQFPVVLLDNDAAVLVDPDLLVRRAFGWLPFWDVKSVFDDDDPERAAEFARVVQGEAERYALSVLAGMVGPDATIYSETEMKERLRKSKKDSFKISDAVVDFGHSWVAVEVTTTQLDRKSVVGLDDASVSKDLDKLIKKAEQLQVTIDRVRSMPEKLVGSSQGVHTKPFYPVLVTAEGFPVNPISVTLIRERLKSRGLLQAPDIMPLEVIDIPEMEMIESLQESGRANLLDLLERKPSANLWRSNMRQYILDELRFSPVRSQRVSGLWKDFYERLIEPYRPTD